MESFNGKSETIDELIKEGRAGVYRLLSQKIMNIK